MIRYFNLEIMPEYFHILDLMFKIAKEKLKELIDKETLDDK